MPPASAERSSFEAEIERGERFRFGANWQRFLASVSEERIAAAAASLREMLEAPSLAGKSFLDAGSGSGLFSLAARRLGARVHSFDLDPGSVECRRALKRRYREGDAEWAIERGSVLDEAYMAGLGRFDIVYSWGVLHHTGAFWRALAADAAVAPGGKLYIALYNHQPLASRYWRFVKETFNKVPASRPFWIALHLLYPTLPSLALKRLQRRTPPRGMAVWRDLIDWLGGYPFEVASPEQVFEFYKRRGYRLTKLKTVGSRMGCNEYVFVKRGEMPAS